MNRRSTPWARASTATAPTKALFKLRQLLNKSVALHAIDKKNICDTFLGFSNEKAEAGIFDRSTDSQI